MSLPVIIFKFILYFLQQIYNFSMHPICIDILFLKKIA
ncbi:hypothetical protein B739_0130 [Riemerella anatipestifer RA-CH-1]|uniref:Uncharacterized protein n=2 Tax=Riemerella anatipestifer TaxID=34085 RepID=J9R2Y3_RIEAN|nr:hypothetical protein B739_0130 [Riemerella anatipestifer RA-CH-1]AGC41166.1 hypothetical protein G148_1862 [Riemerella anatipestifer RA-CH-2]AIH01735.1 hypothetical protein M949_0564 [Riemerella anatipestifer CH3]AKP72017.1 hypothetical protein CG09_1906 [Riemerella anatipestifer]AQY22586.1 hypothetical protein AB406_1642 [Riemerella anatipestifer]